MSHQDFSDDVPKRSKGETHTSGLAITSSVLGMLSLCFSVFTGFPAIILGILALRAISGSGGRLTGRGSAITGVVMGCIGSLVIPLLLLPAVQTREAARRAQCKNNLRQIWLALLNYESSNGCFPPAFSPDENGKPRCSWRVAILPYYDNSALYNSYNFSHAWDHSSNATTINTRVSLYTCPSEGAGQGLDTNYLMVTGTGAFYDPERASITKPRDITDGTSSTIGVVQSSRKVHWASPDDLVVDINKPLDMSLFKTPHRGRLPAVFLDGSVRFLKPSETVLRALLSIAGGEKVPPTDSF